MNIHMMETAAEDVSGILKLLSNPKRLLILCQLVADEKSVGELARLIGASQVTVSQQLSLLKNTGVVTSRREAQSVFYRLDHDEIRQLIGFLYTTFCPEQKQIEPQPTRSLDTPPNNRKSRNPTDAPDSRRPR